MTDRLLAFANHPWTAPVVRALGLPAPRPLPRSEGPYRADELAGRRSLVVASPAGLAAETCRLVLQAHGAIAASGEPLHVLVVDATGCVRAGDLRFLHEAVAPALRTLANGGRVVLLAHGAPAGAEAAACARAIEGFTRSVARETGRKGATANCLHVEASGLAGLAAALGFFCSDRSAYVSGQALRLAGAGLQEARTGQVFAGTTAVVTGAAGGIGAATARRLAADGAFVVCMDVPQAAAQLDSLAADLSGASVAIDLTAPEAADRLLAELAPRGGVDILVHNAGITRDRTLGRMSAGEWDAVVAVNLQAVLAIDGALDRAGLLRDGAREICLSSISGIAGNAGQANYSLTKAALLGYVEVRARELARRGITVNAVAPGFIETAMTRGIPFLTREAGRRLNSLMQGGLPRDVAEAIAFLARPDARGITGQTLRVCGQSFLGA